MPPTASFLGSGSSGHPSPLGAPMPYKSPDAEEASGDFTFQQFFVYGNLRYTF